MEKTKISPIQLFAIMFIFDLGTALVVSYGIDAKKDSWLAILLGMCMGMILFFIYYALFRQYPNLPLTGFARKILGKYLGWMIGLLYVMYFLYLTARQVRDFSELMASSTLTHTPLAAIIIPFVLVMCYVLYLGIEVFARTAEVFIIMLFLFGVVGNFFVLISGNIDLHHLRPLLENGWIPILKTAFLTVVPFPFGEMIVFTMILPYLNQSRLVKKTWLSALVLGGIILAWTAALNMSVLGLDVMKRTTFPTLSTIAQVNLMGFIQRLDAIVVFTLLMTVFFKASILLYGAVIGIVDLFKLKNHQQILFPIGCILIFSSLTIASNFSEHIEEGFKGMRKPHPVIVIVIPLLMLIVSMIRNRFKKTKDKKITVESNQI